MADDNIISDPTPDPELTRSQSRIKELSDKYSATAAERDDKDRLLKEEADKRASVERERDFYSGFADSLATNPAAKDHKDEIKEKVMSGYSVEDATYAVLGKAGKLGARAPEMQSPAGGSSPTNPVQGGTKSVSEMTQAEKREILAKELMWT